MKSFQCTPCPLIGRLLISAIFILSGSQKIFSWSETADHMQSEGMVLVPVLLAGAIACEIAGGVSVLFGIWARFGAALLILFLIPTTLIFHDFWAYQDQEQRQQMIHFMKNLAIMGGLFYVFSFGAGSYAVDRRPAEEQSARTVAR
jgi:putative oxidoreductase